MATTDTQQAAQFSAEAAVSAAEAKQYLIEAQQGYQDTSAAAQEAKDAAAAAATSEQNATYSEANAAQSAAAAVDAKDDAEAAASSASDYAKNKFTFYKTASDPDGTIAGLAATTDGQSFWVAQGPDALSAAWQYQNKAGVAVLQAKQPGTAAITGTIREFPTLAAAQADADAGNIPVGSTAYYRIPDDSALAIEVINNGGTLQPTGRKMPSQNHIDQMIGLSDSGNIAMQTDSTGQIITVTDDFGGVSIPDVPGTIQEALAPVKKDRAPAILRLSDAENAAYGSIDDFGGLHVPGLPCSIQDMLNGHEGKIQALIKHRRVLDVRDRGFSAKTGENAVYVIQRCINELSAAGGGIVYLPMAYYPLSTFIIPRSNVSIVGEGDKSVLLPYKQNTAIRFVGTLTNYLENVMMSNFTIEGENQVLLPGASYVPDIKGTYIKHWRNCVMDRVNMRNIGATALGNDMADNCAITRCYIENFGRLAPNPGTAGIWERPLGASGIGIGTGALDDEPLFMAFNTVKTGTNFPMFLEPQGGGAARGAIALGNILMGGYAGLADCGVDGFQAIANQIRLNKFGILRYPGTNNDGKPGRRAQFISNIVDSNEEHGVYSYSTKTDPLIGWNIYAHNQITNNGKDGMNFRYTNPDVVLQNETIDSNNINGNGRHGVNVEAAKAVINCDITNNKLWGNGQKEAGNGVNSTSAIPFTACSINNNKIRDTQAVPTQQYPVSLTGVLTDVDISVNHCVGNVNNTINTPNPSNQRVTKNINSGAL